MRTPIVAVSWVASDRHRWLTLLALAGLIVGVVLANVGLPPVDVHGPWHLFGIMVPTCGVTRAVRLTVLGGLAEAWAYNPLGPILVVGAVAALGRHLIGLFTGQWLTFRLVRSPLTVLLIAATVILLQINQQLHATLLMTSS